MEGSDNESNDASVHNEATNTQQQPNIQPQIITTVSNNNAKFPYLKKDEYEEHIAVQRESKARTTLLQSIPDDHVADFHYMNDTKDIWNAVKTRFGGNAESKWMRKSMLKQEFSEFKIGEAEGLHKGYDMIQKILSRLNQLKAKPEDEDINLKFLRSLPSSWSQVALTLKTKGPSHSAFVSATKKMSYGDSLSYSSTTAYSVISNSKTRSHRSGNKARRKIDFDKKESARFNKKKVKCYMCQQRGHFARECRAKEGNDKQRYSSFKIKEIGKKEEDSKALITVDTLVDWTDHDGAAKIYNLITGADTEEASTADDAGEFALMGVTSERVLQGNQLTLEDKIRVLSIELENTSNLLKHSKRINADVETAKKDLQTKLDNHLVQIEKWRNSSKNLFRLIDSSMSSSEVNTNDFASSDSSVKSSKPKPNNSAEIESNVGTSIQEPIIVQDLPSFSCNSSDKNENTSRTSCNKNGYSNKKACHFRKHASSVSKLRFVCGSGTNLIKDCDFYEQQMANKTVGIGVGHMHCRNKVNHQNQFVSKVVLFRTGKVNIHYARPQPVPTGKQKVFAPVPARRQNMSFSVPTDKGYSPSENPFSDAEVEGIFDSGCSRSMTGNKERLNAFQEFQGRKVTFEGGEGRITGKGTIRTLTLDLKNVYYVKELQQFNLFFISQICNKKNKVLFTDTECLVLSKDFKLPDESMVVLRVPRKHNLYTINLNNLCPRGNLACLVAHASVGESVKWHRRMGHVNYKNMNRLVKGNLVRGLSPTLFKNDHTCVTCCKGKQHKASYKAINVVSSITEPLQFLHMDLFGPTLIRNIDHKYYCLVITDDYSRFCWVFFLEHKDKTYTILKDFISLVENQSNKKIKAIRCDNGTEFKNAHIIELCGTKGIKREYSNARTPQQNGVTERKNRTLIDAARTMLADFKLPTMFWTEAVRTTCHFKPFGCHVTILNTSYHLGKFDGKADEGYIVGYYISHKAYRVYNVPNKRVEETMNLRYLEEKPNVHGLGHEWYFDLDYLIDTLGYKHDNANQSAGAQDATSNPVGAQDADPDSDCDEQIIIVHSYPSHSIYETEPKDTSGDEVDDSPLYFADEKFQMELARLKGQAQKATSDAERLGLGFANDAEEFQTIPAGDIVVSTDDVPVPSSRPTASFCDDEPTRFPSPSDLGNHDPSPGIFSSSSYDDEFGVALNNVSSTMEVSLVATKRINTIHPQSLIIGDPTLAVQTRSKVDAMQEEMQQFKFQNVWVFVDFPDKKYAIGTKWILKNKRDARGIVVRNNARLVTQGHRQEEGIDYDEVFTPVARIKAIRLFLAFASYMGFMVYQMDVKSAFLYGRINKEVYVTQPKGFVDPQHPKKVYKAWCDEFEALMKGEFQMSAMRELTFFLGLQVQQRPDGIFINQDKYVQEILNKFDLGSVSMATTPYEAPKPKSKNESDSPVNVHLYRSMIGSLMYLTASRPDIMSAVNVCSRNQVTPTTSNFEAVKKIFKANKDRKPTTGGCQFLGRRLISWQCKKQTIMATSSTEAEYVAAANCCGHVLWIQN
nr:hypothetical protein [Tanacetum cinerariifolium]